MLPAHATAPCLDKPRGPSSQVSSPTSHFSLARSLRYVFPSRIQMQYLPSPRPRPRQPIASALLPPPTDRLSPLASCILRPCTLRPSPCALRPTVQGLPVTLPPRRLASSRYSVCRSSTSRRCSSSKVQGTYSMDCSRMSRLARFGCAFAFLGNARCTLFGIRLRTSSEYISNCHQCSL